MSLPTSMRAYELRPESRVESLSAVRRALPEAGPGEVLVRVRAASLNARDIHVVDRVVSGELAPVIPLSDGAGEVVAVGAGVDPARIGERVVASFFRGWIDGPYRKRYPRTMMGGPLDGVLADYVALAADAAVPIPDALSDIDASTLPCAGVTAYHALFGPEVLRPGETVLVQGTGGVSVLALQLAHAAGAVVVATSSSDAKLAKAVERGATHVINYRTTPDWVGEVRRLTDGRGVNHVVDVTGDLAASVDCLAAGGHVAVVGVSFATSVRDTTEIVPRSIIWSGVVLRGVFVGSARMLADLMQAVVANGIKPVVDQVLPMDDAKAAYEALIEAKHFGKIVIDLTV